MSETVRIEKINQNRFSINDIEKANQEVMESYEHKVTIENENNTEISIERMNEVWSSVVENFKSLGNE